MEVVDEINRRTLSPPSPHPSASFNIDLILPPNTPFHPPPDRGNPLTDPLTLNLGHWAFNSPGYGYLDDPFEAYAINLEQNTRLKHLAYSAFLAALLVKSHHPRSEFSLKLSILRLYLAIHGVPLIYSVHCTREDIKYVLDGELTEVYEWVFVGRENGRNHHCNARSEFLSKRRRISKATTKTNINTHFADTELLLRTIVVQTEKRKIRKAFVPEDKKRHNQSIITDEMYI